MDTLLDMHTKVVVGILPPPLLTRWLIIQGSVAMTINVGGGGGVGDSPLMVIAIEKGEKFFFKFFSTKIGQRNPP